MTLNVDTLSEKPPRFIGKYEVQSLIGPGRPLTRADGPELRVKDLPLEKSQVWQDGQTSITIVFQDDVVVAKLRAVAPARR